MQRKSWPHPSRPFSLASKPDFSKTRSLRNPGLKFRWCLYGCQGLGSGQPCPATQVGGLGGHPLFSCWDNGRESANHQVNRLPACQVNTSALGCLDTCCRLAPPGLPSPNPTFGPKDSSEGGKGSHLGSQVEIGQVCSVL